ncbi:MAG: hypothetical protein QOJ02_3093 [Acidobacteriota bacterium]|jgi:hypothetical protein|nr:hypothetical protein [Acidobacteriota bacterium]
MTIDDAIVERHKAFFEYLKHLATLSTGSIVLIATFIEKASYRPQWKSAVVVSLVGFIISVICSIVYYSLALYYFPGVVELKQESRWGKVMGLSLVTAWIGMLIGLVSLSMFAVRNLLQW